MALLGLDLGSSNVKAVLCTPGGPDGKGELRLLASACLPAQGQPLSALAAALAELAAVAAPADPLVRVAVTGTAQELAAGLLPALRVNEVVATATGVRVVLPRARTVVDLGGQLSKGILLGDPERPDEPVVLDFASNGPCAAGSGAFLEQQAGRLGLSVAELGRLARDAARGATIAGRCSVFAKSDMIHLQQKGTPVGEIAYGLCQAMVRTFISIVGSARRLRPPVAMVGGGAANPGLVRALGEALGLGQGPDELCVPEGPLLLGARGAALLAARAEGQAEPRRLSALAGLLAERLAATAGPGGEAIAPPPLPALQAELAGSTRPLPEDPAPPEQDEVQAWLGIDVGSVSTNLVLLSPDREVLQGIYLPTRGRPVEVLHAGLTQIGAWLGGRRLHVLGVGATGSGRHLAARVLGADVVHNEITAQLLSATHYLPEVDTVFEIGGQDSKYIAVRDGHLADFEMNKICAAGTGSFLEEQAQRLGVPIIDGFSAQAFCSSRPCDLGSRCTVFMDAELVRAQQRGAGPEDLCAGLAYSVARNYLEKVVAGRPVGQYVVFQGGTASNRAVVAAFAELLGRPVHVHPYNRISGAIGAALLAERELRARPRPSRFLGLGSCAGARGRSFECKACDNRCQVNRIQVGERVVHFGDVCERYSERDREHDTRPRPFPELFAERDALLAASSRCEAAGVVGTPASRRIGLLRASLNLEYLPLWAELLRSLGYEPVLAPPLSPALLQAHGGGVPAELCLPVRAAAAQARALLAEGRVERVFVPAVLESAGSRGGDGEAATCYFTQGLADMLRVELGEGVCSAQLVLEEGVLGLLGPAVSLAEALGCSPDEVAWALARGRAVQAGFVADRTELGRQALRSGFDRAVVVLGRPYNTHDPALNLALARQLERLGLPAIPWDLLPLEEVRLGERWRTMPWHFVREGLRALELMRRDGRLFPIFVSSYGCGPDAFAAKHLEEMLAGRPRLLLEFDEHRGEAGLVTRLEAFADEIEEHLRRHGPVARPLHPTPGPRPLPRGRRFFLPSFPQAEIYAGALRGLGHEATVMPPPDEESIRLGEAHSSGRECHPYAIVAGDLLRLAHRPGIGEGDVFLCPSCTSSCLLRQYGEGYRILLKKLGLPRLEVWDAASPELGLLLGSFGLVRFYEGLLAADILLTLGSRLRAYVHRPEGLDALLQAQLVRVAGALAERRGLGGLLGQAAGELWELPRHGAPGERPVVGVTGDLYTRIHPAGNAQLFARLEELGCEVWPSPFFAASSELGAIIAAPDLAQRARVKEALLEGLTLAVTAALRRLLVLHLPPALRGLAVEPPADELLPLALPFVGPRTSHLIQLTVAKAADFFRRGASGVVNAAGLNCMVGTLTAALLPAVRQAYGQPPAVTLLYGGNEGPAQRIRLETFAHQVHERWRAGGQRAAAARVAS